MQPADAEIVALDSTAETDAALIDSTSDDAVHDGTQDDGDSVSETPDGGPTCGNGDCDPWEFALGCPADCGGLLARLGATCVQPGSWDGCNAGFVCAARAGAAGGPVCVADFHTWPAIPNAHPLAHFTQASGYAVDAWTGLMWAKASEPLMAPDVALASCASQTYGGFDDWRLPTMGELESLVDRSRTGPASSLPDAEWFTDWLFHEYWSGTPELGASVQYGSPAFYDQDFFDGRGGIDAFNTPLGDPAPRPVRCVRGGSSAIPGAPAVTRFVPDAKGLVVMDRLSGLYWQWYYSSATMDATAAAQWCTKNTAGMPGTGWRLPTAGEFQQVADRSRNPPKVVAALAAPSGSFWTSSPGSSAGRWTFVSNSGLLALDSSTVKRWVKCVRPL